MVGVIFVGVEGMRGVSSCPVLFYERERRGKPLRSKARYLLTLLFTSNEMVRKDRSLKASGAVEMTPFVRKAILSDSF